MVTSSEGEELTQQVQQAEGQEAFGEGGSREQNLQQVPTQPAKKSLKPRKFPKIRVSVQIRSSWQRLFAHPVLIQGALVFSPALLEESLLQQLAAVLHPAEQL